MKSVRLAYHAVIESLRMVSFTSLNALFQKWKLTGAMIIYDFSFSVEITRLVINEPCKFKSGNSFTQN